MRFFLFVCLSLLGSAQTTYGQAYPSVRPTAFSQLLKYSLEDTHVLCKQRAQLERLLKRRDYGDVPPHERFRRSLMLANRALHDSYACGNKTYRRTDQAESFGYVVGIVGDATQGWHAFRYHVCRVFVIVERDEQNQWSPVYEYRFTYGLPSC